MRRASFILILLVALAVAQPADAQLRSAENAVQTDALMTSSAGVGFLMKTIFNPQHFSMGHAFEMSFGSGGYGSLAMYTNSLQWEFGSKLAARADVAVAYSPFGGSGNSYANNPASLSSRNADVFLRNAQVTYMPSENVRLNLSYHRSPYGRYLQPYGLYRPVD
jgi:hypothetical protein